MLLQESDEDASSDGQQLSTTGRVPRSMTCYLERDLVDCCVPGDFVHVCGVVSLLPDSGEQQGSQHSAGASSWKKPQASVTAPTSSGGGRSNVFHLCLRANSVTLIFSRSGEDSTGNGSKVAQCLTSNRCNNHTPRTGEGIDPSMEISSIKTTGQSLLMIYGSICVALLTLWN